jgi:hypothetical protein
MAAPTEAPTVTLTSSSTVTQTVTPTAAPTVLPSVHGAHITISTTYNFDYNSLNTFEQNSFRTSSFAAVAETYHAVNPSYTVAGLANSLSALQDNNDGVDVIVHGSRPRLLSSFSLVQ